MAWIVRLLAVAIFVAQSFLVWSQFDPEGAALEGAILIVIVSSALFLPLLLARNDRGRLNLALLVGLIVAALLAFAVSSDDRGATNSTAALWILAIPYSQWFVLVLASAIGLWISRRSAGSVTLPD